MAEPIVLITEPLLGPGFIQWRVAVPLARRLSRKYDVTLASSAIAADVEAGLRQDGISPVSAGTWFPRLRHPRDEVPSFILSWVRESLLGTAGRRLEGRLGARPSLRLNLSMTASLRSDLWYLQSRPLVETLHDLLPSLRTSLRLAASASFPTVRLLDRHGFAATARRSAVLYANCGHLAAWYRSRGYAVEGSIPEFLYPEDFGPTTSSPSRDYVLVYLGKETDVEAILGLIRLGYPVKAFGGKSAGWVASRLGPSPPANLELLGSVTHSALLDLYSNARFTAFPFTDESFGLVPVESMACGTPVLTYGMQGPGETVLDGRTGWLVGGRAAFVEKARELLRQDSEVDLRSACLERGERYGLPAVTAEWERAIARRLDAGAS